MKKIITLVASLVLMGSICYGQMGLGAGFVKQSLNEKSSYPLAGFYVKADYTILIWKQLAVSVGLDYSRLTATLSGKAGDVWISSPTAGSEAEEEYTEQFLTLPVQLRYVPFSGTGWKVFIFGGPSLVYDLSSRVKTKEDGKEVDWLTGDLHNLSLPGIYKTKVVDFSNWSIGIGGGIGVEFLDHFRVLAGYDYGLNNRYNSGSETMHLKRFYVGASYLF